MRSSAIARRRERRRKTTQHEKPIALAPALFLLVCQVCRWFTAPRPAQTRTRSLHPAAPPADNSTGFCACTLYLVFKEPTPTRAGYPLPVAFPSLLDRL